MTYRYYILSSLCGTYSITAKLAIPEADEVCAMTHEVISGYSLEFASDLSMVTDTPLMKKIILPCKHSFSAMACVYHFCKNQMRCPLCREGSDCAMDPQSLPVHLQAPLMKQVNTKHMEDRAEEEMDNYREAVALLFENIQENLESFTEENSVVLVAYCYDEDDQLVPLVSFDYELRTNITLTHIEFVLPRYSLRQLSMSISHSAPLNVIEFAIGIRSASRDFVFIDRSIKLNLNNIDDSVVSPGQRGATFHVQCENRIRSSLMQFMWRCSLDDFSNLIDRRGSFLLSSF